MHFFKFKHDYLTDVKVLFYTLLTKLIKNNYIKIYNLKKQIKINFKHKKLSYRIWVERIVFNFWIIFFKNRQIIDFKHKKLNYFQINRKIIQNQKLSKSNHSSKSIIQKIVTESTLKTKYKISY